MSGKVKEDSRVTSSRCQEHLLPAFRASIVWIENILRLPISMKCGFRGALASGVVLCRLLNAIEPGTIRRINQCPNRASATDNLSLFLYACEEKFEIPQSRMFSVHDFEDIFDQGVDANIDQYHDMRHSEKVVITLFWLAKSVDLRDRFSYLPKLDYNAFSAVLPKTLIQRKFSVSTNTSSTPAFVSDTDSISCSSDVSLISPTKRPQNVPRRVSQPKDERLVVIKPRTHRAEDSHPSSIMGNSQTATPHDFSEIAQAKELGDTMPSSAYTMEHTNDVNFRKDDNSKYTSVLIERIPQPAHSSNPYPPSSESGHAEIIITNNSTIASPSPACVQVAPTVARDSETALRQSPPPTVKKIPPLERVTHVPIRPKANGISGSVAYQLNNNMIGEEEAWQSSLAEWRERRRKLSRLYASRMTSLVAEEEAEDARRAEEVRERLRNLKTHRSLIYESHFPLPYELFSPPPSSPGIALLTGVGPKLSEITDESEDSPPVSVTSETNGNISVPTPQLQTNQAVTGLQILGTTTAATSDAVGAKVNGHSSDKDNRAESFETFTTGTPDALPPINSAITPETRITERSTAPSESVVKPQTNGCDFKVVKFCLQCKPGSKEVRWGLTIHGEGPDASAPFVVDHIKIGSAADLSEINKGDILIDINGQNLRQVTPDDPATTAVVNNVKELEQLMDTLALAKKSVSIRVLRKLLRTDEFSDTELEGDSVPVVSLKEADHDPNNESDIDGDVWEQTMVATVPPATIRHPTPPAENWLGNQLVANDVPQPPRDVDSPDLDYTKQFQPDNLELSDFSRDSARPTIPPPAIHQTDTFDNDLSIDTQLLQSSAPVNTAALHAPISQSEECGCESQRASEGSVRQEKATLADPITALTLATSLVPAEEHDELRVKEHFSCPQDSIESQPISSRRSHVETIVESVAMVSPPRSPFPVVRHSPLPPSPPPHPLRGNDAPSSPTASGEFNLPSQTTCASQPHVNPSTSTHTPFAARGKNNTLPSPPPPNYFAAHNQQYLLHPTIPSMLGHQTFTEHQPTAGTAPSAQLKKAVSVIQLPPKGFTASGDICRGGVLPKPPVHPPAPRTHGSRGTPNDSHRHRSSLPAPTSPLSLRRDNPHHLSSSALSLQSLPTPPYFRENTTFARQPARVDPPPQPPKVPLDRGINPNLKCNACNRPLGTGDLMIISSMSLHYHLGCFVCARCGVALSDGLSNADVRIRNQLLYCDVCYPSRSNANRQAGGRRSHAVTTADTQPYNRQPYSEANHPPIEHPLTTHIKINDRRANPNDLPSTEQDIPAQQHPIGAGTMHRNIR